jgi:hypothetical protein
VKQLFKMMRDTPANWRDRVGPSATATVEYVVRLIGQDGKRIGEITLPECRDDGHAVFHARKFTGTAASLKVRCGERLLYVTERGGDGSGIRCPRMTPISIGRFRVSLVNDAE